MKNNNQGFTLVELIVSIAILSLLSFGATYFLNSGVRTFNTVESATQLQFDSQIVMAQVEHYILSASEEIYWDELNRDLYLTSKDETGATQVSVFSINSDGLTYGEDAPGNDIVSRSVTTMDVKLTTRADSDGNERIAQVELTIEFLHDGRHYMTTQYITLRNAPKARA